MSALELDLVANQERFQRLLDGLLCMEARGFVRRKVAGEDQLGGSEVVFS
jgi:hypothetical protein